MPHNFLNSVYFAPLIVLIATLMVTFSGITPVQAADPSIYLHQSGQTSCYDTAGAVIPCAGTGQDGEVQMGAAASSPRFTDNTDGTVTDTLTGLMWLKDANCYGAINWYSAIGSVNALASGTCSLTDASTAGQWRLPNRTELLSLFDASRYNPILPAGHPFSNVQNNAYWTSTAYADEKIGLMTWTVLMQVGYASYYNSPGGNTYHVWPVRNSNLLPY